MILAAAARGPLHHRPLHRPHQAQAPRAIAQEALSALALTCAPVMYLQHVCRLASGAAGVKLQSDSELVRVHLRFFFIHKFFFLV